MKRRERRSINPRQFANPHYLFETKKRKNISIRYLDPKKKEMAGERRRRTAPKKRERNRREFSFINN